jgi:NitT/TauT family transport system substrate-binding protein
MIDADGMRSTSDMLVRFEPELKDAKVDLSKTFDPRFVQRAAGMTH